MEGGCEGSVSLMCFKPSMNAIIFLLVIQMPETLLVESAYCLLFMNPKLRMVTDFFFFFFK